MSRFGPDPLAFFTEVYREPAPWDVGAAQPALDELLDLYPPAGPGLDVGCGTGDLAIALARREVPVLGVDFVEGAIAEARARAATLPADVRRRLAFRVADALRPSALEPSSWGPPFGAVVDSGFLHLFEEAERDRFAADLARVLRVGGRYYLLAFAVTFPGPQVPRAVEETELRRRFSAGAGWRVLHCAPATFASRVGDVPALAACLERTAEPRA
ncbi:MAG TPA: class I SAM-dependent methyltransferase [Gemmatimonadales bacterium]|nr:class I SAM-dependent methyltransferase [Gemmatimonadales bacterium]